MFDCDPRDYDSRDDERHGSAPPNHGNRGSSDDRDRDDDRRQPDFRPRDRDGRERDQEPRDAFARHVHLPRGLERELVRHRDREHTLRGSESRTLATVGAFRVVSSRDLRDHHDRPADQRSGDLRHLREQG